MIHDNAHHPVLKVGDLTRDVIAGHLVSINRNSVVNLACACQYLEEPRVQRYVSVDWMRKVRVLEWTTLGEDTLEGSDGTSLLFYLSCRHSICVSRFWGLSVAGRTAAGSVMENVAQYA